MKEKLIAIYENVATSEKGKAIAIAGWLEVANGSGFLCGIKKRQMCHTKDNCVTLYQIKLRETATSTELIETITEQEFEHLRLLFNDVVKMVLRSSREVEQERRNALVEKIEMEYAFIQNMKSTNP